MTDPHAPVLLYDGDCGLCNAVVRFLLRHDRTGRLHFGALQDAPAQDYLRQRGLPTQDFSSLVYVPDWAERARGDPLLRTDGALAAFAQLGGPWRRVLWLRAVPRPVRDLAYAGIARVRYSVFGPSHPRPPEDPSWNLRFLGR